MQAVSAGRVKSSPKYTQELPTSVLPGFNDKIASSYMILPYIPKYQQTKLTHRWLKKCIIIFPSMLWFSRAWETFQRCDPDYLRVFRQNYADT